MNPSKLRVIDVPLVSEAAAFSSGDVLTNPGRIKDAVRQPGGVTYLVGIDIYDKDDQTAAAMEAYISQSDVPLAAKNAAPGLADADAVKVFPAVSFASGDFKDLGGTKVAGKSASDAGMPRCLKAADGSKDFWLTLVTGGTPTQTVEGLFARVYLYDAINP